MNAIEIVRNWNLRKGTRYKTGTFEKGLSSVASQVNTMIETLGEEDVTLYYLDAINNPETNEDIWRISDVFLVKAWLAERENNKKEQEVEQVKEEPSSMLSMLGNEIVKLMGTELANNIGKEVENKINEFVQDKTLIKVVDYNGEHKKVEGVAHEQLETIIKFVAMNEPVMMVGPAGTGKNVIAKQVADALGLDFYFSNAVTQEYKITGYGDANGEYVKTQFFDAFTKGGLFLLDEMDASCPEALIVLNCAIANRYFDFPVIGRVQAHLSI